MLTVNEYFSGQVKSIALENAHGRATIGVMEPGEYEFGTATVEYMNVVSGILTVLLPGSKEWRNFSSGETFIVPANAKFRVKVPEQTAYYCRYE